MKARRKGPISIVAATIFSLSAIVEPVGAAQAKDSADASVGGLPDKRYDGFVQDGCN